MAPAGHDRLRVQAQDAASGLVEQAAEQRVLIVPLEAAAGDVAVGGGQRVPVAIADRRVIAQRFVGVYLA